MDTFQPRKPPGSPDGGQFSTKDRPSSGVDLQPETDTQASGQDNQLPWQSGVLIGGVGSDIAAEAPDGAVISFHTGFDGEEVHPSFTVQKGWRAWDSDDPADWPEIEKYVPREKWPEGMYVGKHGPTERNPDPAVETCLAKAESRRCLDLTEGQDLEDCWIISDEVGTCGSIAGTPEDIGEHLIERMGFDGDSEVRQAAEEVIRTFPNADRALMKYLPRGLI